MEIDNKVKLLNSLLIMMEEKNLANTKKDDNEKEREENKLFFCIFKLFIERILNDSTCESQSIELKGLVYNNILIIYRDGNEICCGVNEVQGVDFSTVIKETLEMFESVKGFVTSFYGNDSDGYTINITGSIRGRN